MPQFDIDQILIKYIGQETLSAEESAFLTDWLTECKGREELIAQFKNHSVWFKDELSRIQQFPNPRIWARLTERLEQEGYWQPSVPAPIVQFNQSSNRRGWRYAVAATICVIAVGGTLWGILHRSASVQKDVEVPEIVKDAQPGRNRAFLTLSNGDRINLDSVGDGLVANQGIMQVSKLADGRLAYTTSADSKSGEVAPINVLTTPKAGQFKLSLPDGSRVWLNNASSLSYPVYFSGNERQVELTGEAFFEIEKDPNHAFVVNIRKGNRFSRVKVLGTTFNVMAYDDEEAERTSLVEGSVRFVGATDSAVLSPKDQIVLDKENSLSTIHNVNISEITAWKNGYFHFFHTSLENTMRQLARWYDVDIICDGSPGVTVFTGKIQRSLPLSAVLSGLENDHIRFSLEGRTLKVTP